MSSLSLTTSTSVGLTGRVLKNKWWKKSNKTVLSWWVSSLKWISCITRKESTIQSKRTTGSTWKKQNLHGKRLTIQYSATDGEKMNKGNSGLFKIHGVKLGEKTGILGKQKKEKKEKRTFLIFNLKLLLF